MIKKKIVIHIGQGKTGTSAIQSFLAANSELMRKYGVDYPYHPSFEKAQTGKTSSGNYHSIFEYRGSEYNTVLFSSELFFNDFREGTDFYNKLRSLDGEITILCFTRDLFDHFRSSYGQYIKRGNGTISIEEFANKYKVYLNLKKVLDVVESLQIKIVIRNYSHCFSNLEDTFVELILGDRAKAFLEEAKYINVKVNRSLTYGELEVQRLFNLYAHQSTSAFVSDIMVDNLPNLVSDKMYLCQETFASVINNNGAAIEVINNYLPADEKINCAINNNSPNPSDGYIYGFSKEQLNVLIESICNKLNASLFSEKNINLLRNIALKYENSQKISKTEALALMSLALVGRPDGQLIRSKVAEWGGIEKSV